MKEDIADKVVLIVEKRNPYFWQAKCKYEGCEDWEESGDAERRSQAYDAVKTAYRTHFAKVHLHQKKEEVGELNGSNKS